MEEKRYVKKEKEQQKKGNNYRKMKSSERIRDKSYIYKISTVITQNNK